MRQTAIIAGGLTGRRGMAAVWRVACACLIAAIAVFSTALTEHALAAPEPGVTLAAYDVAAHDPASHDLVSQNRVGGQAGPALEAIAKPRCVKLRPPPCPKRDCQRLASSAVSALRTRNDEVVTALGHLEGSFGPPLRFVHWASITPRTGAPSLLLADQGLHRRSHHRAAFWERFAASPRLRT